MSAKKVAFGAKPTQQQPADQWVESRTTTAVTAVEPIAAEEMKRLTIDIPASLHRAIKSQCAMRGSKIADEVRELLLQNYGNQ